MSYIRISDMPKIILGDKASKSQIKSCKSKIYYRLKKFSDSINIIDVDGHKCIDESAFELLKNSLDKKNIDAFLEVALTTNKTYSDETINKLRCYSDNNEYLLNDYCALSDKYNCLNSENKTLRNTIKSLQSMISDKNLCIEEINKNIDHINNNIILPLEIELNEKIGQIKEKDLKIKSLANEIITLRNFIISFSLISNSSEHNNSISLMRPSKHALITKTSLDNLLNIKGLSSPTNISEKIFFSRIDQNLNYINNLIESIEIKDNVVSHKSQEIITEPKNKKSKCHYSLIIKLKNRFLSPFISLRKITKSALQLFCKL